MKVFFCRHGQTQWNQQGRLQGHLDSSLSPLGVQQALQLGQHLSKWQPQLLLSSDLGRAQATAQLVNEQLQVNWLSSSLLRERSFGLLEGQLRQASPHLWQAYDKRFLANELAIEGAEPATSVVTRINYFLAKLSTYDANVIVVICHGEWLRILQHYLNGLSPWLNEYPLPNNCEVIEYTLADCVDVVLA
ncbi:histidine phosphatase family protein [Shewanella intestini]|uniref:Histidine phosphatase family protein n=1 Tax=Shewanella intestini TaxID=2017544 RepID=A0ABS5I245_9GAMM|nr:MULTISPECIES: histidine phosphatase family protein [Shewanella]MBR9727956.1 histidine phosphatase family protein [Shewanella intestini]MRG36493.1 histidine phosphatase family protein [Shewanella sp. XMDDZSB0408]